MDTGIAVIDKIGEALAGVRRAIDTLRGTREEMALQARDIHVAALLRETKTPTSTQLLQADFGTACPRGLDVDAYADNPIEIVSLLDQDHLQNSRFARWKELKYVGGRGGGDHRLYLHPAYLNTLETEPEKISRGLSEVVGHEHIHILQGNERISGMSSAFTSMAMHTLKTPEYGAGFTGRIGRLYQIFAQASLDLELLWKTGGGYTVSAYFSEEAEMQARLHEIIVKAYVAWPTLPRTKTELSAALVNAGVKMPGRLYRALKSTEEGRAALKNFPCSNPMFERLNPLVQTFNMINDYVALPSRRKALWQTVYPYLYGNLLEHYGDRLGRERMGLGSNPVKLKELLHILKNEPAFFTVENAEIMVEEIPLDRARELLNLIMVKAEENAESGEARVRDALLRRPDVVKFLKADVGSHDYEGATNLDPLYSAIIEGCHTSIKKLLDVGVNPMRPMHNIYADGTFWNEGTPLVSAVARLKRLERNLEEPVPGMKKSEREDALGFWREEIKRSQAGLQTLADFFDNLDEVFSTSYFTVSSAREALARANIYPSRTGSSPSAPSWAKIESSP